MRIEILQRLAIVTAGAGILVCWLTLIEWPLPVTATALSLLLVALSLGTRALAVAIRLGLGTCSSGA